MTNLEQRKPDQLNGVWFVYDGECPVCTMAAEALQIKRSLGTLNLLDARQSNGHPLVEAINSRQMDLDEGMVIYHDGRYYHGATALRFMAVYGAPGGLFNKLNRLLFRSKIVAGSLYPAMRACRNLLLKIRRVSKIQNLKKCDDPIFKPIFGSAWGTMPPALHMHYKNRPFTKDTTLVEGTMSVWASWPLRLMFPLLRVLGNIPTKTAENIPVTVEFRSEPTSDALNFIRTFNYPTGRPYIFHSRMMPQGGNRIVERMKFGFGWRVAFTWKNQKVLLQHQGYALCLFSWTIPLPLGWLFGHIHAEEWQTGADSFAMFVEITHPLFGKIYDYRGEFCEVKARG